MTESSFPFQGTAVADGPADLRGVPAATAARF